MYVNIPYRIHGSYGYSYGGASLWSSPRFKTFRNLHHDGNSCRLTLRMAGPQSRNVAQSILRKWNTVYNISPTQWFPWNRLISFTKPTIWGENSCEVAKNLSRKHVFASFVVFRIEKGNWKEDMRVHHLERKCQCVSTIWPQPDAEKLRRSKDTFCSMVPNSSRWSFRLLQTTHQ